ncbi:TonB-dependent receptor plug domain-containing protein [Paraglaciecola chathamensis]|uniref:TonB-dependent receptor n=1 Tax=Paraglaciecola chathamensis TaxID=368405 RepID=UPI00270D2EB0|nr:TonB-dependent receptor plug domain-containing protein [Paraglaciecola chathamensis]MDO6838851.1 TonB-dependent receptor plug domain-containing protein [Paraglaciecola chathamensis]
MKQTTFRRSITALAVAASLGFALPAFADNTTANISGSINANDYSQYTVIAKDPATGLERVIAVSDEGSFRFAKLPTGTYDISVMKGDTVVAEQKTRISLGSNTSLAFDFIENDGTERIEVTGARISAIDLSSADSGLIIDEVELDRMPVSRNITAVALLAPGTVMGDSSFSSPNSGGTASFGGASVAENSCYINGMEVTNTSQGLGCGTVPFEFYKEFQVKTGGYSAQFGRTTGGVLNAVTKSGSNEWEFTATALFTPKSLREDGQISYSAGGARGPVVFRNQSKDEYSKSEFTLSASGALIEDTLFFYALVNPRDVENNFASQSSGTQQYAPDDNYIKRDSSGSDNLFWGAKVDWFITDDHKISLFGYSNNSDTESTAYEFDRSTGEVGDALQTTIRERGGDLKSISYTGNFTDELTVSAMYGEIETSYTNTPSNLDCPTVLDTRDVSDSQKITSCGSGGTTGVNEDKNKQTRIDIEYAFEDHLLRVGYDKQERETFHTSAPITGHSWTYSSVNPNGVIPGTDGPLFTNTTGAIIDVVADRIFTGGGGFSTDLNAWYIEDEWQVTEDLMLSIGLRRDEFENSGVTGKVFSSFKTDVAPRLGFSWDPTGEGDSKVYGTYGTYYLPVANNTNYRAASGLSDTTTYYTFDGADATGAPTGTSPVSGTVDASQIVNSVPNPATQETFQAEEAEPFSKDEYIVGYEKQINDEFSFSVRAIYREVATALDDYCGPLASQATCTLLNPGKSSTWQLDNDFDSVTDPNSRRTYTAEEIGLPEAENEYTALQPQVNYRGDNMRMSLIYTWSRSVGNFEGAVKSDIGQADAGVTQDFDFPALMDGSDGYQPNDRRHVFKFFGSYDVTEALTVGFNSTLSSGRPLSAFGQGYPSDDPAIYGSYGDTFYLYTNECPDANGNGMCEQSEKIYQYSPRGSKGRTPWTFNLDLSANYNFTVSDIDMRATLNVYNVLNGQAVTSQNEHYENRRSEGSFNQYYGAAYTWQSPRYVEVGFEARF